ncbi:MAG: DUF5317 family protein, partial [Candidatus Sulfotelmatobacter sp.]
MYSRILGRLLLTGVVTYLLFFMFSNRILQLAISITLAGSACNVLVILANGGRMPVRGNFRPDDTHCALCPDTKFRYLCDRHRIAVRRFSRILSIGDIFIYGGKLLFFARILTLVTGGIT